MLKMTYLLDNEFRKVKRKLISEFGMHIYLFIYLSIFLSIFIYFSGDWKKEGCFLEIIVVIQLQLRPLLDSVKYKWNRV